MITTTETPAITEWIPAPLYRLTVDQYEAMVASGAFTKRDKLHLINGLLVKKITKYPPHTTACFLARRALDEVAGTEWHTRAGEPVRILPWSEPEPDVALVRGDGRDYATRHPEPSDVAILVEVADSSLCEDRKLTVVYGPAGIPIYWIINLVDRQVEVYTGPCADGYAPPVIYISGSMVPVVIDGRVVAQIAVDDLLP